MQNFINNSVSRGGRMDLKFSFILNTKIPNKPAYSAYENGFMEGELEVCLNERIFFHDPSLTLH